jgi:hypothetical protein
MKKEEMMKFCRYYKGEEENPFRSSDGPKYAVAFWRLECAWVNGYRPQYTMALFKKFWPQSKPIFDTAGKGLPKSLKDSIASDIICGVNLMAELDPIEVLSAYFGLPCEDPSMVKEEETKKEPEVEPAQEEDEDAFFDEEYRRRKELLKFCRYYHEEKESPFDYGIQNTFWGIEKHWVERVSESAEYEQYLIDSLALDFPDYLSHIGGIPRSLKGNLLELYEHWYSGTDGFEDWLRVYLQNDPSRNLRIV